MSGEEQFSLEMEVAPVMKVKRNFYAELSAILHRIGVEVNSSLLRSCLRYYKQLCEEHTPDEIESFLKLAVGRGFTVRFALSRAKNHYPMLELWEALDRTFPYWR